MIVTVKGDYAVDNVCTFEMCVCHSDHVSHAKAEKKKGKKELSPFSSD